MTRRPEDDDDETPVLPAVTVPPWLRTGDGTGATVGTGAAGPGVPTRAGGAGRDGTGGADEGSGPAAPGGEAQPPITPTRIRLGGRSGAGPRRRARGSAAAGTGPTASGGDPIADRSDGGDPGPAPIDALSILPLRPGAPAAPTSPSPRGNPPGPAGPILSRAPVRVALAVTAGAAVLGGSAVVGFLVTRGAAEADALVSGAPLPEVVAGCADGEGDGYVMGSGPGSPDSPAGAVFAFDHAYYVDRSAAKAFEAVSPSSRMTQEQLHRDGIGRLPDGTGHCVVVSAIAPSLLEVELTEFPPGADPVLIRQRVRVAENPDGTWGIVSLTPAG